MATGAIMRKEGSSGSYTYSSQPRVVQQKGKYRETEPRPSNIMFDRRIVRGNTYALHSLPASTQPNPLELQRQQESRRRVLARKRVSDHLRIRSPPPVDGRKHIDIQTELYLEEITDRVEEADVSTQTDAFLDRPPTPLFIPAKTGMDVATQIEEGELFDFDLEVKPILEVLVGKTVEQALLEVMEEEELSALREQQRIFEENRNAELVETQRLEEQERRNREEKERRIKQQRQALMKEKETADKVSARAFAQSYLSDLIPAVFTRLSSGGFFYDPIEREIETMFMPWLMDETEKIVNKQLVARQLLDVIIRELVKKKLGIHDPVPDDQTGDLEPQDDKDASTADNRETQEELSESKPKTTSDDTTGDVKKEPTSEVPESDKSKTQEQSANQQESGKTDETTEQQQPHPTDEKPSTDDTASVEKDPGTSEETKPDEATTSGDDQTKPAEPQTDETKTEEPKNDEEPAPKEETEKTEEQPKVVEEQTSEQQEQSNETTNKGKTDEPKNEESQQ